MADLPRITILITPHNQAEVLERAIRSVLEQSYPQLELIIVDSDSNDGSREIIESFADRLHWWCSRRVTGAPHAANIGLDKATGDLITWLRADAWYLPGALQSVGRYLLEHSEIDFLYGCSRLIDEHGTFLHRQLGTVYKLEDLLDLWNAWWAGRRFRPSECFWSRRVFLKTRAFRENFLHAYAYEYWTRLFLTQPRVTRLEEDLCCLPRTGELSETDRKLAREEELQIVEPILWERQAPLDPNLRSRLQADWLYQTHLLPALQESIDRGDTKWQRRLMMSRICAAHPRILRSEQFRERFKASLESSGSDETSEEES